MGLKPLEFTDCLLDSPYFRESIRDHERELDQANDAIKGLIKECRNLFKALENLSKAQKSFTAMLEKFKLRYIGEIETDDDMEYEDAFPSFAGIFQKVEEERERMLDHANVQLIEPLEKFRKEQIGKAKEEKKKFDRETERVCGLLESHMKISPKKRDNALQEADAQLEHEMYNFREISLNYVSKLQEVNEKKKFELVEIVLAYMYGQATFYHNGHEVFQDSKTYMRELLYKLQTTRERFDVTKDATEDYKTKTKKRYNSGDLHKRKFSREGYLHVYDRRKSVLSAQWVKHYCMYTKENKILTMVPYSQTNVKLASNTDTMVVTSCIRKTTEASERRFLFDITGQDISQTITLQAVSDEDRRQWLEVMEGKEPTYMESSELISQVDGATSLNETGISFVKKCMEAVEKRGITDQGIYRVAGVSSKFNKLLNSGMDPKQLDKIDLISDDSPWDIRTITSAMKQYFRNLSEPIFTFKHHEDFLNAIKLEGYDKKISKLKELVELIPKENYKLLNRLMYHLKLVAENSKKNLMQEGNLGVVLGPTLMRPQEETMAAIMSIKFQSIVIETIIKEYYNIFIHGLPPEFMIEQPLPQDSASVAVKSPSLKYRAPVAPSNKPLVVPRKLTDSSGAVPPSPAREDRHEIPRPVAPVKPKPKPPTVPKRKEWKVRALYDCAAENPAELSFNKDAIISNVRMSTEEGWLIGMLNGKTGLVPENYCEKIE